VAAVVEVSSVGGVLASLGQKGAVEGGDHRALGEMGCEQRGVKLNVRQRFPRESVERATAPLGKRCELGEIVAMGAAEESQEEKMEGGAMGLGKLEVLVQDVFDVSHGEPLLGGLFRN
jgi:hypothetical protein